MKQVGNIDRKTEFYTILLSLIGDGMQPEKIEKIKDLVERK